MVTGLGFGNTQGQSTLIFENSSTGVTYQAEVVTWSGTSITAIVPRLANTGSYTIKVVRVAIVAGTINAQESNPANFMVTSGGAGQGRAIVYPNPFNPIAEQTGQPNASAIKAVTIAFDPGTSTQVGVYIYDMTAKLVYREVVSGSQMTWNGYDRYQNLVGDGAYILRIVDEDSKRVIASAKILVIKK